MAGRRWEGWFGTQPCMLLCELRCTFLCDFGRAMFDATLHVTCLHWHEGSSGAWHGRPQPAPPPAGRHCLPSAEPLGPTCRPGASAAPAQAVQQASRAAAAAGRRAWRQPARGRPPAALACLSRLPAAAGVSQASQRGLLSGGAAACRSTASNAWVPPTLRSCLPPSSLPPSPPRT